MFLHVKCILCYARYTLAVHTNDSLNVRDDNFMIFGNIEQSTVSSLVEVQ